MHNVYPHTHTHTQSTYNGLTTVAGVRKKIMPVRKLHSYDHCIGHGVTKLMIRR